MERLKHIFRQWYRLPINMSSRYTVREEITAGEFIIKLSLKTAGIVAGVSLLVISGVLALLHFFFTPFTLGKHTTEDGIALKEPKEATEDVSGIHTEVSVQQATRWAHRIYHDQDEYVNDYDEAPLFGATHEAFPKAIKYSGR